MSSTIVYEPVVPARHDIRFSKDHYVAKDIPAHLIWTFISPYIYIITPDIPIPEAIGVYLFCVNLHHLLFLSLFCAW
jgi:hypothetical protein